MRTTRLAALVLGIVAMAQAACTSLGTGPPETVPAFNAAAMEVLGRGYDLTGNYADVADVKAAILDLEALKEAGLLHEVPYEPQTYRVVGGTTSNEFQRNLSIEAGIEVEAKPSIGEFSGAVKASFKKDRYENRDYSFAKVQSLINKHGLRVAMQATPEDLRGYLTPAAASALQHYHPEALFDEFGAHVVIGVVVGGRLDLSAAADMAFERQGRGIDVYVRASLKNELPSAAIEAKPTADLSWSEYLASAEKRLDVYGGRSDYRQSILNEGLNEGVYVNWIESVDQNAVFVDFARPGLIGVWELIVDEKRRAQVKQAWAAYAERRGITLAPANHTYLRVEHTGHAQGLDFDGKYFYSSSQALVRGDKRAEVYVHDTAGNLKCTYQHDSSKRYHPSGLTYKDGWAYVAFSCWACGGHDAEFYRFRYNGERACQVDYLASLENDVGLVVASRSSSSSSASINAFRLFDYDGDEYYRCTISAERTRNASASCEDKRHRVWGVVVAGSCWGNPNPQDCKVVWDGRQWDTRCTDFPTQRAEWMRMDGSYSGCLNDQHNQNIGHDASGHWIRYAEGMAYHGGRYYFSVDADDGERDNCGWAGATKPCTGRKRTAGSWWRYQKVVKK